MRTTRRRSSPSRTKRYIRRREKGATVRCAPAGSRKRGSWLGSRDERLVNPPGSSAVITDANPFIGVGIADDRAPRICRKRNGEVGARTFANVPATRRLQFDVDREQRFSRTPAFFVHRKAPTI